jgi:chemotaxis signal transduction protein
MALAVDSVVGVRPIRAGALHALPPLLRDSAVIAAIGVLDAQLLVVLQASRLLPEALPALPATDGPPA